MKFSRSALASLALSVAAWTAAGAQPVPAPADADAPPPPIRAFDQATIGRLGAAIYKQDREAWRATDLVLQMFPDTRGAVAGWVVTTRADGDHVTFVQRKGDSYEAAHDVLFRPENDNAVMLEPPERRLSADQLALIRAQNLALDDVEPSCTGSYNYVALPYPEGSNWLVWVLAANKKAGEAVIGRHYRFTISHDGGTILRRDALTRGCLVMPKPEAANGKPEAVVVSSVVSSLPVETHVFNSLSHQIPILVVMPDKNVWAVEGAAMRTLDLPEK